MKSSDKGGVSLRLRSIDIISILRFAHLEAPASVHVCVSELVCGVRPLDRPCQPADAWVGPPSEGHTNIINLAPRDRPVLPPQWAHWFVVL